MAGDHGFPSIGRVARAAILAGVVAGGALPRPAGAAAASSWDKGAHAAARLIDGGFAPEGGARLAGVEVRLDPRFITYWRDPGEAGVPPTFDFAGSTNLRSAEVRFPAPRVFDEGGVRAIGYSDGVVFPLVARPIDPAKPIGLRVALDYAACYEICLPVKARLAIVLDGRPSAESGLIQAALAAVPRRMALGDDGGPLAIVGVAPQRDGGFRVEAKVAADGMLLVEGPEGWSYAADAPSPAAAGHMLFPVKRLGRPSGADRLPGPLTLTLVSKAGAVEVPAHLDDAREIP